MITFLLSSGMTQLQISKETGINQPAISRLAGGKQEDIGYTSGKALEALFLRMKNKQSPRKQKKAA